MDAKGIAERFGDDQDTLKEWVELWADTMVDIWKAKLKALGTEKDWWVPEQIYDDRTPPAKHTWEHLQQNVKLQNVIWNDPDTPIAGFTITHTFNLYGVWVDAGVGREMGSGKHGMVRNELGQFLPNQKGMSVKRRGKLTEKWSPTRKAKHWYSTAYWRSCKKLLDEAADDYTLNFEWLMYDLQKSLSFARMLKRAKDPNAFFVPGGTN